MTATEFYAESLRALNESGIPYLVGGTLAFTSYTGIKRETKDMDVFCRAGDFPKVIAYFSARGFTTSIVDERWLAKVIHDQYFFDVLFNSANSVAPVADSWFEEVHMGDICGLNVRLIPPTEIVWSKIFVQDRHKYDGNDVAHLILKQGAGINWKRLLAYMEPYWEVLFAHLINFRFVYPSERNMIPKWLLDELMSRLSTQAELQAPQTKVCRGRLYSRFDYETDVKDWGFADVVGDVSERSR